MIIDALQSVFFPRSVLAFWLIMLASTSILTYRARNIAMIPAIAACVPWIVFYGWGICGDGFSSSEMARLYFRIAQIVTGISVLMLVHYFYSFYKIGWTK